MKEYVAQVEVTELRKVKYDVYLTGEMTNHQAQRLAEKYMLDERPCLEVRGESIKADTIDSIELDQEKLMALDAEASNTHMLTDDEAIVG